MGLSLRELLVTALFLTSATTQYVGGGSSRSNVSLPVVDLGYERQRANLYNYTGGYYNFSNIRYAAPPTGNLRFRAPEHPAKNRSVIQTGSPARICAQASPAWELIAAQFIPEYLTGQTKFNSSSFNTSSGGGGLPAVDPRTTEDCLFLDVFVPKKIFESAGRSKGAPVLVWIYGGGYTEGDKTDSGDPAGLILRSQSNNSSGIIYVAMNYRLGAFGWLSGPTFQEDGTGNVGLWDQRFALQWVQKYIHKFGGDPDRVTVIGESAGGGSIMHQITAFGDQKHTHTPFQQAILQSPGFAPVVSNHQQEQTFNTYLNLLGVSTIDEARNLSFTQLMTANTIQVGEAPYGGFAYGPAVDGDFVPALPGQLLLHGQFPKKLNIMVGHNADEGLLFTSPFNQNNSAVKQSLLTDLPTLRGLPAVAKYILNTLYPPVFDGSQAMGYTNQIARAAALISELIFTCNTFYLDKAYNNQTHSYYFTIPPALHGEDIPYTYYNGPNPSVLAPKIAIALQTYITNFAMSGNPNGNGVPYFPTYGDNATVLNLNYTGIMEQTDPTANYRCDWWQKVLYE